MKSWQYYSDTFLGAKKRRKKKQTSVWYLICDFDSGVISSEVRHHPINFGHLLKGRVSRLWQMTPAAPPSRDMWLKGSLPYTGKPPKLSNLPSSQVSDGLRPADLGKSFSEVKNEILIRARISSHYAIFYVYVYILFIVFSKFQIDQKVVEYEVKKIYMHVLNFNI